MWKGWEGEDWVVRERWRVWSQDCWGVSGGCGGGWGGGGGTYLEGLELEDLVLGETGGEGDGGAVVGVGEGGGHFAGGGGGVDAAMLFLGGSGEEWPGDEKRWCCSEFQECCCGKGSHHGFVALKSDGKALIAAEALPPAASFVARGSIQGGCGSSDEVWWENGMDGGRRPADGGLPPTAESAAPRARQGKFRRKSESLTLTKGPMLDPDGSTTYSVCTFGYIEDGDEHLVDHESLQGASPQRTHALGLPRTASQSPCKWADGQGPAEPGGQMGTQRPTTRRFST